MSIRIEDLDPKIMARGKAFFDSISGEAPSVFNKGWWIGKVMDWSMKNEDFKVQMFRFVDVLPYLTSSDSLSLTVMKWTGHKSSEMIDKVYGHLNAPHAKEQMAKLRIG